MLGNLFGLVPPIGRHEKGIEGTTVRISSDAAEGLRAYYKRIIEEDFKAKSTKGTNAVLTLPVSHVSMYQNFLRDYEESTFHQTSTGEVSVPVELWTQYKPVFQREVGQRRAERAKNTVSKIWGSLTPKAAAA